MVDRSNQEQQILEAMEACRPGHDDMDAPEMAHLAAEMVASRDLEERFARLQQTDGVLADAIRDVSVPEGLADRLRAALQAASASAVSPECHSVDEPVVVPASVSAHRRAQPWWFAVAGVVAAMVLVAVSVWQSGRSVPWTPSTVLEEAISRYSNENQDSGRLVSEASPPWALPLSSAVRSSPATRWRPSAGFLDRKGRGLRPDQRPRHACDLVRGEPDHCRIARRAALASVARYRQLHGRRLAARIASLRAGGPGRCGRLRRIPRPASRPCHLIDGYSGSGKNRISTTAGRKSVLE